MNTTTPRWQDLLAKLIYQDHHEAPASEVELYQAQPALGLDLGIAWSEALLPGQLLAEEEPRVSARFPGSWNAARHVTLSAPFPCCIGMAPQFLQKIDVIMDNAEAFFSQETVGMPMLSADITLDNKTPLSQMAIARIAGDAQKIESLIPQLEGELLQKNERAAQLWFTGRRDEARAAWDSLDGENPVIAFNQGLGAMAVGDVKRGRECLLIAVEGFPDSTGWHHLAELFLATAE